MTKFSVRRQAEENAIVFVLKSEAMFDLSIEVMILFPRCREEEENCEFVGRHSLVEIICVKSFFFLLRVEDPCRSRY